MANNRMFLVNRPTGLAVVIGKNLTDNTGWYDPPTIEKMQLFYDEVERRLIKQFKFNQFHNAATRPNFDPRSMCESEAIMLEGKMNDFFLAMEHSRADNPSVVTNIQQFYEDKFEPRLLNINENQ